MTPIKPAFKVGEQVCQKDDPYHVMKVVGFVWFPISCVFHYVCEWHCESCDKPHAIGFATDELELV
jgi:hypothetical protein